MNLKIERDKDNHLLTIQVIKEEVIAYQVKMLQNNALPYLLRPQINSMDEEVWIQYDLGHLVYFKDYIKNQGVDYELIKSIIKSLSHIETVLKEYLLEEEKLAIDFNTILLNPENKNCSFVYLPCKDVSLSWRQGFRSLIKEMMKHIRKQDEKAVGLIHKISIIMEEEFFQMHSLDDVLKTEEEISFYLPLDEKTSDEEIVEKKAVFPKGFLRREKKNRSEEKRKRWTWKSEGIKVIEKSEVIW